MSDSSQHLRLALTVTHLLLVALGSLNVLVIFLILSRPYLRSITNVYMVGLCLADFIYLTDLSLVAATSLNLKSWPFGSGLCHFYHGTETTGKYASVLFVVLLAADRYLAMCKTDICARFRNYRVAMILSTFAWVTAIVCSLPLYLYAKEATFGVRPKNSSDGEYLNKTFCLVHWPSTPAAQWTPFWLFNLFSSIFRVRITSQLERIVVNIIHLFPYVNCALNPLLYAYRAENFRIAFKSMFMFTPSQTAGDEATKTGLLQKRPSSVCQDEANGGKDRVRSSTDETWRTQSVTDNPLRRCVKPGKNEKAQGASLHVRFYPQKPVTQNIILPPSKEDRQDSITLL
ncbi:7 transmembrane receptor [Ancylostoma ceylanicum]|uniref:7 transmembrane receptor n=1 Tax=Ancylostoma ceylanicum TaxID=53326 RepID=A0A0D6MB29_9BILA|nr:7 transmembrane receptor [Ancylostoma ceylanicum]